MAVADGVTMLPHQHVDTSLCTHMQADVGSVLAVAVAVRDPACHSLSITYYSQLSPKVFCLQTVSLEGAAILQWPWLRA